MTINKRTGVGVKDGIVAAATDGANAAYVGNAEAAFLTADAGKIVCIDGKLKIV